MPDPISIAGGLLTAEAIRRAANRLDDTDEELEQALHEGDLEQAILIASDDRSDLQRLCDALGEELREQGAPEENITEAIQPIHEEFMPAE